MKEKIYYISIDRQANVITTDSKHSAYYLVTVGTLDYSRIIFYDYLYNNIPDLQKELSDLLLRPQWQPPMILKLKDFRCFLKKINKV